MWKKSLLTLILSLLAFYSLPAQALVEVKQLNSFEISPMQQLYISAGPVLYRYTAKGQPEAQFSQVLLGNISSFDVSDPLRILLFYRESNTLIQLNRQLTPVNDPVLLDDMDQLDATLVCSSNQGGFWLYDALSQSLRYYDAQRELIYQSQSLSTLTEAVEPVYLQEFKDELYLSYSGQTLVFDLFATYLRKIPEAIKSQLQYKEQALYFFNGEAWGHYHHLDKEFKEDKSSPKTGQKILPFLQKWLWQDGDKLYWEDLP